MASSLRGGLLLLCRCRWAQVGVPGSPPQSQSAPGTPQHHLTAQRCQLWAGLVLVAFRWEAPRRHLNTIHVTDLALRHSPRKQ